MKVLLVVCGPFRAKVEENHGRGFKCTFEALIRNAAHVGGLPQEFLDEKIVFHSIRIYENTDAEFFPEDLFSGEYGAIIFSGSRHNVTEHLPWSERAADFIRREICRRQGRIPILAICYGHQLLSYAFGGSVSMNPRGHEFGTFPIRFVSDHSEHMASPTEVRPPSISEMPEARFDFTALNDHTAKEFEEDPLMRKLGHPRELLVQAYHMQSVVSVPEGSVRLFESQLEPVQFLKHAPYVYGCQFHPEFYPALFRDYEPYLGFKSDDDRHGFLHSLQDTEGAMKIVSAFLELAFEKWLPNAQPSA